MSHSLLYIIGTPLGNRNDMTERAKEMLGSLSCLLAEDTRELRKLLKILSISLEGKRLISYSSHNMKQATEKALSLLREGHSIGLVSDRGTPCISDPGMLVVRRAIEERFKVVPIPGPSSVTAALSVSGFSGDRFLFLGFLPPGKGQREALFRKIQVVGFPVCFFESPGRIRRTLEELAAWFPEGNVFLAREMTKIFESFQKFALADLGSQELNEKGEFTVVLDPGDVKTQDVSWEQEIPLRLSSDKEWAKHISKKHSIPSKEIYNALQKHKTSPEK